MKESKYEMVLHSIKGEIVNGLFDFCGYWEECEANLGHPITEEEAWNLLIEDLVEEKV